MRTHFANLVAWGRQERGLSEIFSTIFILPLVIALIFVLVEIGFNMRYRMAVDDIVNDTARAVASDGTAGVPPQWSSLYPFGGASTLFDSNGAIRPGAYNSSGGATWERVGQQRLQTLCGSGNQRCTGTPTMRCTPTEKDALPSSETWVAPDPGLIVRCTANFPYKNLVNFTVTNVNFNLGFGTFWSRPIVFTAQSRTMVGSGE